MSRRSARDLPLPSSEALILKTLPRRELLTRVHQLYSAGWTLNSIGQAFSPAKGRSSIKAWVDQAHLDSPIETPIPIPTHKTHKDGYQRLTPVSPGVPEYIQARLREIAPQARLYRHRMSSNHPYAKANQEMNEIVRSLKDHDVSIADIARAANVTHRAIAKRLER